MIEALPEGVRDALALARRQATLRSSRLCVHDGDAVYRINRLWDDGFAIDAKTAHKMRGRVAIYDGSRQLYQCLVIDSHEDKGEQIYQFKWRHGVPDRPPADFIREADAPIAAITAQ